MDNHVHILINGLLGNEALLASFVGVLFIIAVFILIMRPVVRENALR